jgi:hypothetical protein
VGGVGTVKGKGAELHEGFSSSPGQIANTLKIKTPLMFYLKKVRYLEEGSISEAGEYPDLPETALRANRCHCLSVYMCIHRERSGRFEMFVISVKVIPDNSVGIYRETKKMCTYFSVQNIG